MDTEQQQLSVEIKNIGNGPLVIARVRLTEDDDISELSLLMLMIGRLP